MQQPFLKTIKLKKMAKQETIKVRFLLSPSAKFLLAHRVGQVGIFPKSQALEIIEAGYGEKVK